MISHQKSEDFGVRWRRAWMLQWCLITFQEWALSRFWGPAVRRAKDYRSQKLRPCWLQPKHFFFFSFFFLKTPSTNVNLVNLFPCPHSHLSDFFFFIATFERPAVCLAALTVPGQQDEYICKGIKGQAAREHPDRWCVITNGASDVGELGLARRAQSVHSYKEASKKHPHNEA